MSTREQLLPLTGFRFVAAFLVLLAHSIHMTNGTGVHMAVATRLAELGMSTFFVLSGFVIFYNYQGIFVSAHRISAVWNFFVARFARLYPLYICSLFFIVGPEFSVLQKQQWVTLQYISMTQSWFANQLIAFPPAWSVSTEWFFYFAFILLGRGVLFLRNRLAISIVIYIAICYAGLNLTLNVHHQRIAAALATLGTSNTVIDWLAYYSPVVRVCEFAMGVLIACAHQFGTFSRLERHATMIGHAALLMLLALFVANMRAFSLLERNFLYAPILAALLWTVTRSESNVYSKILGSRLSVGGGEISYSLYLMQHFAFALVVAVGSTWVKPNADFSMQAALIILFCISLTFIISVGTFQLIEVPARKALRNLLEVRATPLNA